MGILRVLKECIVQKYASARGRASRYEFFVYLVCFILFCSFWCLFVWSAEIWAGDINLLDFVLMYVPFLFVPPLVAVTIRRLHDANKSGWLILVLLIPLINILGFGLLCLPSTPGENRYGPPSS